MLDFARVGLLIAVLMFSVQANERAKALIIQNQVTIDNSQLTVDNAQVPIDNAQLAIDNGQLTTECYQPSIINCELSITDVR